MVALMGWGCNIEYIQRPKHAPTLSIVDPKFDAETKTAKVTVAPSSDTQMWYYKIEEDGFTHDIWTKVEVNVPVYADSFRIEPNESKELSLPVTDTDTIEKGKYRVCLEISISEITGELTTLVSDDGEEFTFNNIDPETSQKLTVYGEFTVE